MRALKKNKTLVKRELFSTGLAKNRRFSANTLLNQSSNALANQIIKMLLDGVYQIQQQNECYFNKFYVFWKELEDASASYHQLMQPQTVQKISAPDEQPQPEQKKSLGPPLGKISLLNKGKPINASNCRRELMRQSINNGGVKIDRDSLINQLKKDYQGILHSRYESSILPIEDSRVYFKQRDSFADFFRNCEGRQGIESNSAFKKQKKQQSAAYKKKKIYSNRKVLLDSAFKGSAVETQTNFILKKSQISDSFDKKDTITARQSNFKEISSSVKHSKEIINTLALKSDQSKSRFQKIQRGQKKYHSQMVEHSLEAKSIKKEETIQTERKQRRQIIQICSLPKIYKA